MSAGLPLLDVIGGVLISGHVQGGNSYTGSRLYASNSLPSTSLSYKVSWLRYSLDHFQSPTLIIITERRETLEQARQEESKARDVNVHSLLKAPCSFVMISSLVRLATIYIYLCRYKDLPSFLPPHSSRAHPIHAAKPWLPTRIKIAKL